MSVGPREGGGVGGSSGALLNSSTPTQGPQTITFLAFDVTTSVIIVTSTSMSTSQVVSTTATTLTVSTTRIATLTTTPTNFPTFAFEDNTPLLHDSIIISSVLGGFTILLISTLALIYWLYKRRKRQRQLDYSPPFTSLAPPPRSALSPLTIRSSPVPPEEPQETSLSMGPGIHTATEPPKRNSNGTAQQQQQQQQQQRRSEGELAFPIQNLPAIVLQPSSPSPVDNPQNTPGRPRAQSRLYHDLLREETENDVARRHGRLDGPGQSTLRPISGLSDITDMETGQLRRPSGEGERGRWFPSTRASSGVFPDD